MEMMKDQLMPLVAVYVLLCCMPWAITYFLFSCPPALSVLLFGIVLTEIWGHVYKEVLLKHLSHCNSQFVCLFVCLFCNLLIRLGLEGSNFRGGHMGWL